MIYFIQGDTTKRIKIGQATNVDTRLQSLQTASAESLEILGTMRGERPEETKLHVQFAFARIHGEWFEPHASLLQFIAENATPPDGFFGSCFRRTWSSVGSEYQP